MKTKLIPNLGPDRFSRRALLKRLGVGAGMLPLLESERARAATASGFPKRFISVTVPNGTMAEHFYPPTISEEIQLGQVLQAFEPIKSKLLMPVGLDLKVALDACGGEPGGGHMVFGSILTGTGKMTSSYGTPGGISATGPSIDVIIADEIAKTVKLTVPRLNVAGGVFGNDIPISRGLTGQKNGNELYPNRVYDRLFAGSSLPQPQIDLLRLRRKSVIDFVKGELADFGARLGTEDRFKIDAHLQSIRDLESDLDSAPAPVTCSKPAAVKTYSSDEQRDARKLPEILKLFFDLTAMAIKCDLTRSVTIEMGSNFGGNEQIFPWLNIGTDWHALSHASGPGSAAGAQKLAVDKWAYGMIADFAKDLDATVEGSGTTLDNCIVLTNSDMCTGQDHRVLATPWLIIGSGGGAFKTGRAPRYGNFVGKTGSYWTQPANMPHNRLLASICNAMDVPVTGVGAFSGTLPGLTA